MTSKETENMTLAQFQAAMREGKVEVKREGSHEPTADQVTMGGRFGCNWFAAVNSKSGKKPDFPEIAVSPLVTRV